MIDTASNMPHPKLLSQIAFVGVLSVILTGASQGQKNSRTQDPTTRKAADPCFMKPREERSLKESIPRNAIRISYNVIPEWSTSDWDCDGIADPHDNCVGIANRGQADANRNGIGDACEAAATARAGKPLSTRADVTPRIPAVNRRTPAAMRKSADAEKKQTNRKTRTTISQRRIASVSRVKRK